MTNEDSAINLKHRLLGAAVLLLLIVIFVPIMFQSDQVETAATEIDPSEIDFSEVDPVEDIVFRVNEKGEFKRVDIVLEPLEPDEPQSQKLAEPIADFGINQVAKPSVVVIDTSAPTPSIQVKTPVPPLPKVTTKSSTKYSDKRWMIQLGSFSKENNAQALGDKLRAKQFLVDVDVRRNAKGDWWRVRVGPEPNKAQARVVQKALKKMTGLEGMLVQLP